MLFLRQNGIFQMVQVKFPCKLNAQIRSECIASFIYILKVKFNCYGGVIIILSALFLCLQVMWLSTILQQPWDGHLTGHEA